MPAPVMAWRGNASCASNACHGATSSTADAAHRAYTTWMGKDKHVQAYDVLLTERSRIIERNYNHATNARDPRPEKDRLCLRCHSMDADAVLLGREVAWSDGIGCERCHGPAENWLAVHFRNDWKALSSAEKEKFGFRPTKDLKTRALLCVECHVGSGEDQVDHDLYAAGHPRLNFEMSSYVATMPPHWSVFNEKARIPDVEARLWAIGQVASAKAALELLAVRADEKKQRTWPEFAEYDCYACHHDLPADSARHKRGYAKRLPGTLPWNDWYYAMFRDAAAKLPLAGPDFGTMLDGLAVEMNKPLPNAQQVAEQARTAARSLDQRLSDWNRPARPLEAATVRQWLESIRANKTENWDCAAQRFLGLAALHNTMTDLGAGLRDPESRKQLETMAKQLRFAPGLDSPRNWPPEVQSPRR
jgi:hypothetical protein